MDWTDLTASETAEEREDDMSSPCYWVRCTDA